MVVALGPRRLGLMDTLLCGCQCPGARVMGTSNAWIPGGWVCVVPSPSGDGHTHHPGSAMMGTHGAQVLG